MENKASGDDIGVEKQGDKINMEKTIEELILQELRELKGSVNSLGERMDALEKRMDSLETRMDSLEKRMDSLETRMDSLEKRMDSLETRMDALEKRMDSLEKRMSSLEEHTGALEKKVDSLEMRMINTEEMISDMVESIVEIRTACNSLLDWADRVHSVEYKKDKNYPQVGPVGTVDFRGNAVGEEHARYYVESGGKRTYY